MPRYTDKNKYNANLALFWVDTRTKHIFLAYLCLTLFKKYGFGVVCGLNYWHKIIGLNYWRPKKIAKIRDGFPKKLLIHWRLTVSAKQ